MSNESVAVTGEGESSTDEPRTEGDAPNWSVVNWLVIAVFTVLTFVGIALAVGLVDRVVAVPGDGSSGVTVPLYVYLYSGFGALGYVFTKLMVRLDRYTEWSRREHLVAMAMRIPAAWILATGIYLFLGELGGTSGTGESAARVTAGVAFLVGLYVNVAHKALGSIADRILGRAPRKGD